MQHRMHLVLQSRPMPHQRGPQPHLLPPRLRLPVRFPRLRNKSQRSKCASVSESTRSFFSFADAIAFTRCGCTSTNRATSGSTTSRNAARTRTPPPPPAPVTRETDENTYAAPASRCSPAPPVRSCPLLPPPSCNRISGEDLRQRDHLVPPSGLLLRARTLPLEARLFSFHYIWAAMGTSMAQLSTEERRATAAFSKSLQPASSPSCTRFARRTPVPMGTPHSIHLYWEMTEISTAPLSQGALTQME